MSSTAGRAGQEKLYTRSARLWYPWYVLFVLTLVYALNFIDRQVLTILAEDIKRDLRLKDTQLGFLYGTAFAIFYSLFGIPLGRLADNWRRGRLIGLGVAMWSGMTILSGLSHNFGQLAASRVGVGIGEASAGPAAFSLISDHFSKERRGLATSLYSAGLFVGMGVALPLGALATAGWNSAFAAGHAPLGLVGWQATFLVVGLPGLLLALLVISLREPLRGASDGLAEPIVRPGVWRDFGRDLIDILPPLTLIGASRRAGGLARNLALLAGIAATASALAFVTHDVLQWASYGFGAYAVGSWVQGHKHSDPATFQMTWGAPAFVLAAVAFGTTTFVAYSAGFWGTPYVLRTFYGGPQGAAKYLAVGTAREEVAYFGMIGTLMGAVGVIAGGWLSDFWRRRDARGRVGVGVLSVCLYVPLLAVAYSAKSALVFFIVSPLAIGALSLFAGAGFVMLQDMVLPRMRATAASFGALTTTMLGLALGPYTVGKIAALTGSLSTAMLSLLAIAPLSVALFWLVSRRLQNVAQTDALHTAIARGEASA